MYKNDKINFLFINWLKITFILIFIIISVGGLTRLTNSGLSIIEWELFKGIFPPLNKETWMKYFDLYKTIPQFELINSSMTLDEFKVIFYWEYIHRLIARLIGLFFLIPLIYFYFIKKINRNYINICFLILTLIILQGIVGWYMVKSGLVNDITVSHYRLSLHLSMAFIIISIIFWLILNFKMNTSVSFFSLKKENIFFLFLFFLLYSQIIIGAFVSGLDAGKIYQTWPLMGETYFPNDIVGKYLIDFIDFDNHSLVQFYHRNLAYIITFLFIILGGFIIFNKKKHLYNPLAIVIFILTFQIILGIFTLISGLNIVLALAHQLCSVILVISTINLYYYYIK